MEAIADCDAELVPATGPEIDQLVAANPYYVAAPIPGGVYETVPDPLPSFGVVATVVTTSEMSADVYVSQLAVRTHCLPWSCAGSTG